MHGLSPAEFLESISSFLGTYYLVLGLMNAVAAFYLWQILDNAKQALIWLCVSLIFVMMAPLAYSGDPAVMAWVSVPEPLRNLIDAWTGAVTYSVGSLAVLIVMFIFRKFFVKPVVAWTMLNLSLLLMGVSMTDLNFADIVMKPDNVPSVAMV